MARQTDNSQIMSNELNGEIDVAYHDDDIIYIQNLRQVKYQANMQVNKLTIICCVSGRMEISVDTNIYELTQNCLLTIYPNSVISKFMLSVRADFKILCISSHYIENFLTGKDVIHIGMFLKKYPLIHLDENKLKKFLELIDIFGVTCDQDHPFYKKIVSRMVEATLYALLGFIKIYYKDEVETNVSETNRGEQIFRRFMTILMKYDCPPRNVGFYADELYITPKYLSNICKEISGRTASSWITEYDIKRIKHKLRFSNLSVKEVSTQMGFPNNSFFSQYFKMKTGYTPSQYRKLCETFDAECDTNSNI